MVPVERTGFAIAVVLLLGACATDSAPDGPVTADQSPYDHSSFNPRPHDYRTLGLDRLSGTLQPTTVLMNDEPDLCYEAEFPFEHTFYVADQIHTAWHVYEEESDRTFDNVVVTIDEYDPRIECHPSPEAQDGLYCLTRVSLGIDLETSGAGGPTVTDHGWVEFFWTSYPETCAEADHRLDLVASKATEGAIDDLFKNVERMDREELGLP